MRITPFEVLTMAVRAEQARQPDLARELYTLAGRMDREPGTDGLEPISDEAYRDRSDALAAAYARGLRLASRFGIDFDGPAIALAAGSVS